MVIEKGPCSFSRSGLAPPCSFSLFCPPVPFSLWPIQSKRPPPSQPFGVRGATSASVGRMAKRRCGKLRGTVPRYFPLVGFALRLLVSETGIFQYTWVCLHTRVLVTVWRCLRHRMGRAQGNRFIIRGKQGNCARFIYAKSI